MSYANKYQLLTKSQELLHCKDLKYKIKHS